MSRYPWLYAILDEGHVIRNPKSKTAQACYAVNAKWVLARQLCVIQYTKKGVA